MSKRIDTLTPGDRVTLRFHVAHGYEPYEETAKFIAVTGTGDDRRATFLSKNLGGDEEYFWDAYRFEGRWVYGSGALRLSVVA